MVGFAGSPTYTPYVDMSLTRSKVKVTGLLNFRQLAKPCMLAAMTAAPLRDFLVLGYIFTTKACIDNRKNLLNSNISSTFPNNVVNFGPLTAEIGWRVGAPQPVSTGFASWLRYCTDVAQRKSTKLCTMFRRLLGWYIISAPYIVLGRMPLTEFCVCKIHFASKSCVLLYWHCYCTVLVPRASAKFAAWYKEWNCNDPAHNE